MSALKYASRGTVTTQPIRYSWKLDLSSFRRQCGRLHVTCPRSDIVIRCSTASSQPKEGERSSLIPESLQQLEHDLANGLVTTTHTDKENQRRKKAIDKLNLQPFAAVLGAHGLPALTRNQVEILQLNIGLYCNQACSHCHVGSSPKRTEMMDRTIAERCLSLLERNLDSISTLDITGGAPELNSQFRYLVSGARSLGVEVIDRCNLTVLLEPGQEDLLDFLVSHRVRVVASLPCYSATNVDAQRGMGVFERSIKGLQMLNAAGYGQEGSGLLLDLVYNPNGAFLAPSQQTLESAYKDELSAIFGIVFNRLFALNNMPIQRYLDYLIRQNKLSEYMTLLVNSFSPAAVNGLMCRNTVSVGWDGKIYDCDFNQQLGMSVRHPAVGAGAAPGSSLGGISVFDIESLDELTGLRVAVGNHCFGCTAGGGSSCQGSTV